MTATYLPDATLISILFKSVAASADAQKVFGTEASRFLVGDVPAVETALESVAAARLADEVRDEIAALQAKVMALETALKIAQGSAKAAAADADQMHIVQRDTFAKLQSAERTAVELNEYANKADAEMAEVVAAAREQHEAQAAALKELEDRLAAATKLVDQQQREIATLTAKAKSNVIALAVGGDTRAPVDDEHLEPALAGGQDRAKADKKPAASSATLRMVIDHEEGEIEGPNGKSIDLPKGLLAVLHELRFGSTVQLGSIHMRTGVRPPSIKESVKRFGGQLARIGLKVSISGGSAVLTDITGDKA